MKHHSLNLQDKFTSLEPVYSNNPHCNDKSREPVKKLRLKSPRIWCVGGGKGGIGKSFISSNMGILLSMRDKKVLLVDADFGAANLHTFVECEQRRYSFSKFLKRDATNIRDVICKTSQGNLDIISGANDVLDIADIRESAISRLAKDLRTLDYDEILIDAGPGTSSKMLDLFLMSDLSVLISTPEPTSIENTYRFLKALYLRRIKQSIHNGDDRELSEVLRSVLGITGQAKAKTLIEIFERLNEVSKGSKNYMEALIGKLDFSLIINQARDNTDESIGLQMKQACRDYFNIDMKYLGHICFSEKVGDSIRKRVPLVSNSNKSEPAELIEGCLNNMLET